MATAGGIRRCSSLAAKRVFDPKLLEIIGCPLHKTPLRYQLTRAVEQSWRISCCLLLVVVASCAHPFSVRRAKANRRFETPLFDYSSPTPCTSAGCNRMPLTLFL